MDILVMFEKTIIWWLIDNIHIKKIDDKRMIVMTKVQNNTQVITCACNDMIIFIKVAKSRIWTVK